MLKGMITCLIFFSITIFSFSINPLLQDAYERIDEANEQIDTLNKQLSWFIEYIDKSNENNKILLMELGQWEESTSRSEELKKNVARLQKIFMDFREQAASTIALLNGDHIYQTSMYATALTDITNWYTNYIHNLLFPQGWAELYKKYELDR